MIMVLVIMPYLIIPFVIIGWYFLTINSKFLASAQVYKRVTSNLRSPVLSVFGEAASGYTVIRSFSK